MLPTTFALLGAATLILGLVALWQSLRHAFGAPADAATWTSTSASVERQALLDEKRSLLESIKDLEFEHQVGKINDKDYDKLDQQLRARAREVLRLLDQDIGPFRERAEALIRKHLDKSVGSTPYREAGTRKGADLRTCAECGTVNDIDAKFCKECAHRFEDAPAAKTKSKSSKKKKKRKPKPSPKEEAKRPSEEPEAEEPEAEEPAAEEPEAEEPDANASAADPEGDDDEEEDKR